MSPAVYIKKSITNAHHSVKHFYHFFLSQSSVGKEVCCPWLESMVLQAGIGNTVILSKLRALCFIKNCMSKLMSQRHVQSNKL